MELTSQIAMYYERQTKCFTNNENKSLTTPINTNDSQYGRETRPDHLLKKRVTVVNTGILFVFRGFKGFQFHFRFPGFRRILSDFALICFTIVLPYGINVLPNWKSD